MEQMVKPHRFLTSTTLAAIHKDIHFNCRNCPHYLATNGYHISDHANPYSLTSTRKSGCCQGRGGPDQVGEPIGSHSILQDITLEDLKMYH